MTLGALQLGIDYHWTERSVGCRQPATWISPETQPPVKGYWYLCNISGHHPHTMMSILIRWLKQLKPPWVKPGKIQNWSVLLSQMMTIADFFPIHFPKYSTKHKFLLLCKYYKIIKPSFSYILLFHLFHLDMFSWAKSWASDPWEATE